MATIKECDRCTGRKEVKTLAVPDIVQDGSTRDASDVSHKKIDFCKTCRLALASFYKPLPQCEEPAPRKAGAA